MKTRNWSLSPWRTRDGSLSVGYTSIAYFPPNICKKKNIRKPSMMRAKMKNCSFRSYMGLLRGEPGHRLKSAVNLEEEGRP